MYSGRVTSTGLTLPNGDSKIILSVEDEGVEREEVAPNMRTAAVVHGACDPDAVQDGDVRLWPAEALEHLCSGPLNMCRAPVITLSRSMSVLFGYRENLVDGRLRACGSFEKSVGSERSYIIL